MDTVDKICLAMFVGGCLAMAAIIAIEASSPETTTKQLEARIAALEYGMQSWLEWQRGVQGDMAMVKQDIMTLDNAATTMQSTMRVRNHRLCALEAGEAVAPEVVE